MDTTLHSGLRDYNRNDHAESSAPVSFARPVKAAKPVFSAHTGPAAFGSGWYHDEAIEQARRDAIEARCNPYA